ncbi:tannase/feruloyl esterase family alpha/beta hydrolase [Streptomyces sp. A30]|uniref:tannase/feruloyl esterase family alpha/beta hydrolase n=1 Tax=Streptomyces sp. A30 TaxID=2789273 RepID=UPI00397FDE45
MKIVDDISDVRRYSDDFDGIAAGVPANNMVVQNTFHHAWNVLTNKDADGNYILLADKLPLVHRAVLDACDALDGLTDGLLDDPRRCDFDPRTLVCEAGQDPSTCLTAAQAGVVRRLHDRATDAKGRKLEVPVLSDLKFAAESFWKTVQSSIHLAALDPDLGAFRRGGGKLLLWHGWNDQHISPQSTLAYYDAMRTTMGARAVDRFAKLYLFPGVAHCSGGEGPNTFDALTPVMA